ncbi:DUF4362 domain-containing protein [Bacillus sp. SCS-153A]|uniref:DUF4362 domain-containing protein n=1 Tax=Rossellomorea sedimentorum TaxID=3115294 RepID=UPI003905BCF1
MKNQKNDDLDSKLKAMPLRRMSEKQKNEMHQNLMDQVILHENMTMKQRIKRRFLLSLGSLAVVCLMLFILYVSMNGGLKVFGKSGYKDVIQHYGKVENLEDFQGFVRDIENRKASSVNVIHYGIEGQEFVQKLSYTGKDIEVENVVDGDFNEFYVCGSIRIKKTSDDTKYYLQKCKKDGGLGPMDIDLLEVPHIVEKAFSKAEVLEKIEINGQTFIEVYLRTPPAFLSAAKDKNFTILIKNRDVWSGMDPGEFYHIRFGLHKDGHMILEEKELAEVQEW